MKRSETDLQQEAVQIVKQEKREWELATAFVTEKVAFQMRNLIRSLRKNFFGIFDEPLDPTTGRKKIFIPLTEWTVESVVKNIDLDTKDIQFRARRPQTIGLTALVRNIVKNSLDNTGFGENLDEFIRTLAIDGTAVWSTEEINKQPQTHLVDLLNFYIDPTAHSIADTGSVIERIVISKPEFDNLAISNGWINYDKVDGVKNLARIDGEFQYNTLDNSGQTDYVELFRRRGWIPGYLLSGNEEDKELVPGEIIVSAGKGGSWVLHSITRREDNKNKGYEEAWYTRVPGRWYGRGAAEKALMLQLWLNTVVNIRINRSYVSQLGLWKIRQGSGITPQMLSRLGANGAVLVQNMQDVEQLVMQEASSASYKDEETIVNWTRMVTSAFESVTGESMPSTTTATTSALTSQAAGSSFVLIKEGIGMFLERWLKNQALPIIIRNTTRGDIIRYYPDDLKAYDEMVINQIIFKQLQAIHNSGFFIDPIQVETERQRAIAQLQKQGDRRFIELLDNIDVTEYDVEVQVTNEDFDKGVLMQNLLTALQAVPEYRQPILEQLFDLMGLPPFSAQLPTQVPQQMVPTAVGEQNPQQMMTAANTMEQQGTAMGVKK